MKFRLIISVFLLAFVYLPNFAVGESKLERVLRWIRLPNLPIPLPPPTTAATTETSSANSTTCQSMQGCPAPATCSPGAQPADPMMCSADMGPCFWPTAGCTETPLCACEPPATGG